MRGILHRGLAGVEGCWGFGSGYFVFMRRHLEGSAFVTAGRGISRGRQRRIGDPSLRLKNGYARDDAIDAAGDLRVVKRQVRVRC
jgi:hypothetical protein